MEQSTEAVSTLVGHAAPQGGFSSMAVRQAGHGKPVAGRFVLGETDTERRLCRHCRSRLVDTTV